MSPILQVQVAFGSCNRQGGKHKRPPQGDRFNGLPKAVELNGLPKAAVPQRKIPPGTNILARNSRRIASSIDHRLERTDRGTTVASGFVFLPIQPQGDSKIRARVLHIQD